MMKSRMLFFIALGLLIFGIGWYTFSAQNQEPTQIFPATVNRDCAPWDGSAFTVFIPLNDGTIIDISIWQSPDIKIPTTFTFPDDTGQVGTAYILPELDPLQQLRGTIFFWRVEEGRPIEGRFELVTEAGQHFEVSLKQNGRMKGRCVANAEICL